MLYWSSRRSGWSEWAKHYAHREPFQGEWIDAINGEGYRVDLKGAESEGIIFGVNNAGLAMAEALPFRLFHPTLFIPWGDIRDYWHEEEHFGIKMRDLRLAFARCPEIWVSIDAGIRDVLVQESHGQWRASTATGNPEKKIVKKSGR